MSIIESIYKKMAREENFIVSLQAVKESIGSAAIEEMTKVIRNVPDWYEVKHCAQHDEWTFWAKELNFEEYI